MDCVDHKKKIAGTQSIKVIVKLIYISGNPDML